MERKGQSDCSACMRRGEKGTRLRKGELGKLKRQHNKNEL